MKKYVVGREWIKRWGLQGKEVLGGERMSEEMAGQGRAGKTYS